MDTCKTCHGSGLQTVQMGGFNMQTTCSTCGGLGQSTPPGGECGTCQGLGKVRERKSIQVDIPPGVDNKARIRLAGQGDAPLKGDGPHGDLFVSINV
jgi:molecular chaperone DnaJ